LIAQSPLGRGEFVRLKFELAAQTFDLATQFLNPVCQRELAATRSFKAF
jgi:hypothetical protein